MMTRRVVGVRLVCVLMLGSCLGACWPEELMHPGVRAAVSTGGTTQGTETHWGTAKGTETHWGTARGTETHWGSKTASKP